MAKEGKLKALQRAYEVDERRVMEEKQKIDAVVVERQALVQEVLDTQEQLVARMKRLKTHDRQTAVQTGDAQQLRAIHEFETKLRGELQELAGVLEERERELERARIRVAATEEELLEVRIEKKKVEKVMESRAKSARVVDAAQEEVLLEELNYYRQKK